MLNRRFLIEAVGIVLAAVVCAAVSNALAERSRKLAWKTDYPNAMSVTRRPETTGAVEPSPAPSLLPFPTPTAEPLLAAPTPSAALPVASPTVSPAPTPVPTPRPAKVFAPHPERPYIEIAPEDALDLHGRKALFIDARRSDDYAAGHIAGARAMPVWEADIDDRVKALYEEGRNQQEPIVIYCSGGNCEDSHMLSQKLWGLGFDNVLVYRDGFPDWAARKGPVSKGMNP